jgi:hypothetical protein
MLVRETNALAASARRLPILRRLAPAICALCAICGFGYCRAAESPSFLVGELVCVSGGCPILRVAKKDYTLAARTTYLYHTLQDQRLANREVRVEGAAKPDGTFEVSRFYTVRDGKLYRVRYYCEVCNIEALEPGNCVCCQQPTELQEIPIAETK